MEFSKPHLLVAFIFLFFFFVTSTRVHRSDPSPGLSPDPRFHVNIIDGEKPPSVSNPGKSPEKPKNSSFSTIYGSLWEIKRRVPDGPNPQQPPEAPSRF
ncbi:hypothetical protein MANES_18G104166v8 [Manihot esculenta]|uniref:Uncharacterized protein n=1 Tax=Manihot esculenta TaxID=3983 RepID=A0ACB7FZP1_MANES|nr:hypothetical protein MANES_18G104166v8 [Manihot esculenta]